MAKGYKETTIYSEISKSKFPSYFLAKSKKRDIVMEEINNTPNKAYEPIDFFDLLQDMTKDPALQLLSSLLKVKDSITNVAVLDSTNLTQVEKNKISKGYLELKERGIVIRVKRGVYLINPRLSPPYPEFHDTVYLRWLQLLENKETK